MRWNLPILTCPILALLTPTAHAGTWTVNADGSGDYLTISQAVDAATSGDTIQVSSGTFEEAIDFAGKNLWLIGEGAENTVLDAGGEATFALTLSSGETATIEGFTIQNHNAQGLHSADGILTLSDIVFDGLGDDAVYGGALLAESVQLSLTDVSFIDSFAFQGGAIWATATEITGSDVLIDGCSSVDVGGGLYLAEASSLHLSDSVLSSNTSGEDGGALYALDGDAFSFDMSTISQNISGGYGAGLYLYEFTGGLTITDSDMSSNTVSSGYGGAIYGYGSSGAAISGTTFDDNTSKSAGGAMRLDYLYDTVSISDSTFHNNSSQNSHGGALYIKGYTDLDVSNTDFTNNETRYDGGAIYVISYCATRFEDVAFLSNSAGRAGGALYLTPYQDDESPQVFTSVLLQDNEAESEGGAISARRVDVLEMKYSTFESNHVPTSGFGGAVFLYDADGIEVQNNLFFDNSAGYGGVFYSSYYGGDANDNRWTNNRFQENHATYGGVGCLQDDEFGEFSNNTLIANTAQEEAAGLCLWDAWIDVYNNVFAYNNGTGLHVYDVNSNAYSSFDYNAFYENEGGDSGGKLKAKLLDNGTNLFVEPKFARWSYDGVASNDALVPQIGSELIDAGKPSTLDPDGSISDIGATGGPDALYEDGDGDGVYTNADCDDSDASVYPGADDAPYDGSDSNCDGSDDYDQDGDGFAAAAYGGEDCDDTDASVTTCADDEGGQTTCGCQTPALRALGAPLLLVLASLARRRGASPTPTSGQADQAEH